MHAVGGSLFPLLTTHCGLLTWLSLNVWSEFRAPLLSMNLNQAMLKMVMVFCALSIGVLMGEFASRLVLNTADFLSPKMSKHNILGHTIESNSAGFDEWGFRNEKVPPTADAVAIGDSHTFGNTAKMEDSWPSVVGRLTGFEVYNLGLGGYGPNQYYHLLMTKGLRLHPKWVICGLYMGDDFENAFSITHGLDYWLPFRKGHYDQVNPDNWDPGQPVWGASLRNWLSSHSMIYRLVFHGPLVAMLKESIRFKEVSLNGDKYSTTVIVKDKNIREAFRPLGFVETLNLSNGPIREGMRITFQLLTQMDTACREAGCRLLVVIIPTKETVFADYIENAPSLHLHDALKRVILNERSVREILLEFLNGTQILYADPLPALKNAVGNQLYAQTTRDMHPGKNGYKVIGEVVAEYLNRLRSES